MYTLTFLIFAISAHPIIYFPYLVYLLHSFILFWSILSSYSSSQFSILFWNFVLVMQFTVTYCNIMYFMLWFYFVLFHIYFFRYRKFKNVIIFILFSIDLLLKRIIGCNSRSSYTHKAPPFWTILGLFTPHIIFHDRIE